MSAYAACSRSSSAIAVSSEGVVTSTWAAAQVCSASSFNASGTCRPSHASEDRLRLGVMKSSTACGAVRSPVSMPSCLPARLMAARQSSTRS